MIRYISGLFHLLVVVGFFGWLGLVWFFGGFFVVVVVCWVFACFLRGEKDFFLEFFLR